MQPRKRYLALTIIFFIGCSAFAQDWLFGPSVLELRSAAQKGDPVAQQKLGQAYETHGDRPTALMWFKRSARQGNAEAQLAVGNLLIGDPIFKGLGTTKDGLRWILLSANQNYLQAQQQLGEMYQYGRSVPQDKVEAFKWYALVVKQQPAYRVYVDNLSLKMTDSQIAEGQNRVTAFKPVLPAPVPLEVKLQGISGTGSKKLAMINGHTFAPGEVANVKAEEEILSVKCVEIGDDSATVQVNGGARKSLSMR